MRTNVLHTVVLTCLFFLTSLFTATAQAAPITSPNDILNPAVEDFEGYVGVSIPDSGFGAGTGLPATGFVFNSGLMLTGPSPNTDDGLIIIDIPRGYGCCVNSVGTAADIISGIGYAADGNPAGSIQTFSFPAPTLAFGMYFASDTDVTLTAYDIAGNTIESQVFTAQATPLTVANFKGIVSTSPIYSFSIESVGFFVYDDVSFGAFESVPVPLLNPGALALLALMLAGFGWVFIRRA